MSVVIDDGDNPPHHFSPTIYHHCFPLSTTHYGHVDSKNEDFSPLMTPTGPVFYVYIKPSKKCKLKYTERGNT